MKTQRIKTLSLLAIAFFMFVGTNMYAQRGRNYNGQGRGLNNPQSCQMIPDLTEDQEKQIEALRLDHLKEMTAYRNQMDELRARKHTLMTTDNADMKEINSIIDQMTDLHNKMMKSSTKHQQSIRSLLTDSQKVYFDSRPRRGRGHGRGYGDGYGRGNGSGAGQGRGYNPNCIYNNNN